MTCKDCSKKIQYRSTRCRSCSKMGTRHPLAGRFGADNPNYVGGCISQSTGYLVIGINSKKQGNTLAHRLVMEKHLGRKLNRQEIVHHINHDRLDNRIENLALMTQSEHIKLHNPVLARWAKR